MAIVTSNSQPQLAHGDKELISLFAAKGIDAEPVIWNTPLVNWQAFNLVLIRSTWDYYQHYPQFVQWLLQMQMLQIKVLNPVTVILQNINKLYLKKLQQQGIEIVPTLFIEDEAGFNLNPVRQQGWQQMVIKPAISAGSYMTRAFSAAQTDAIEQQYRSVVQQSPLLVQPFMPQITEVGEVSLLFFNRRYSHAVLKRPKPADFRVQMEFGGSTIPWQPDATVIATAQHILSLIEGDLLYARVDGVIHNGRLMLMELELTEPYLFFDYCEGSIQSFVDATIQLSTSLQPQHKP